MRTIASLSAAPLLALALAACSSGSAPNAGASASSEPTSTPTTEETVGPDGPQPAVSGVE